eukprot:6174207-Pleurochrysis_carterae.AAC.1
MRRSSTPSPGSYVPMKGGGGVVSNKGLRFVGVLTMSGPEGLGTVNTSLPLAPVWGMVVFDPSVWIRDA